MSRVIPWSGLRSPAVGHITIINLDIAVIMRHNRYFIFGVFISSDNEITKKTNEYWILIIIIYFQRPIKTRRLKVDEDIRGKEKLGSNIKFMTNQKIMQGTSLIRILILMKSPIHRGISYCTLKDYQYTVIRGCLYITSAGITTKGRSKCWQTLLLKICWCIIYE